MLCQVILGCNFLHERDPQVLHRDLKPLNLLCNHEYKVCVGDFGISVRDREKLDRDQAEGTFAYMAPEVVFGRAPASTASDVFSFGVVLLEWFWIRDHPGTDFNQNDDLCYDLIHDPLHHGQSPSVPAWWHPVLRSIMLDCLSVEPDDRPSFANVLNRIRELVPLCKASPFALRQHSVESIGSYLSDRRHDTNQNKSSSAYQLLIADGAESVIHGYGETGRGPPELRLLATDIFLAFVSSQDSGHKLTAAQEEVVERLETLLDRTFITKLCEPGFPWVPLGLGLVAHQLRHAPTILGGQPSGGRPDSPKGSHLPVRVPRALLLLGTLISSANGDVSKWAMDKLMLLPEEVEANSEHVRRELRRLLMSSEVDLDEITGTQLRKMLANRFEDSRLKKCKAMCEAEMVAVMGLLSYGPPSLVLEQIGRRPPLYLGSGFNAADLKTLQECDISAVVNMAPECANYFETTDEDCSHNIIYFSPESPVFDDLNADISSAIGPALEFIDSAHKSGRVVLVHCVQGVSRSASIAIALLMRDRQISYDEALSLVKAKRAVVNPNSSFVAQLKSYFKS